MLYAFIGLILLAYVIFCLLSIVYMTVTLFLSLYM